MKSIQLLTHSIRQVFGNLGAALRISGVLYLVQIGVFVAVGISLLGTQGEMQAMIMAGGFPWGRFALAMIVAAVTGLWIAVAWHRYVLMEEQPGAALPPLHADRMLGYLGRGLLLGFVMVVAALLIGFVVSMVVLPFSGGSRNPNLVVLLIVPVVMNAVILLMFYRLSPILPAAALGQDLSFAAAWDSTRGASGAFLVLGVITAAFTIGASYLGERLLGGAPILLMAWQFVTTWVTVMVGVSILTTIFGHYVEKRALV
jgi:hypothetical protein